MIHVESRHKKIIQDILSKYPYDFYVFGSRVKGTQKRFSDLDLCYMAEIPLSILSLIKEDFEESKLPFEVDLVYWGNCDACFQSIIKQDMQKA